MHPFETFPAGPDQAAIQWFGQDSFALKDAAGTILLVDPFFPHERPPERFIHAVPPLDERSLRTDAVLLTHDHSDHTCIESLLRIHEGSPQARFYGPVESVARMARAGLPEHLLTTVGAGDTVRAGTMTVHGVWSKPPQGVPEESIKAPDVQHLGYVIEVGPVRVYVTGDLINTFAAHDELLAPVARLQPDIGLLTMHPTEGEFPFFEGSVEMAARLGLRAAVPAHYECFVKRTYDPRPWAALLTARGPQPILIPYNGTVLYGAEGR